MMCILGWYLVPNFILGICYCFKKKSRPNMYVNIWYECHTFHRLNTCRSESHALLTWNHFASPLFAWVTVCWCWDLCGCLQALGLKSDDTFTAEMLTSALQEECMRLSSAPDGEFYSLGAGLSWCTKVVFSLAIINSTIGMVVSSTKAETNLFILFLWL